MAEASNPTFRVYGLVATDEPTSIRYVGMTTQPLYSRAHRHRSGARAGEPSPKADWIRAIFARGANIRAVLLEQGVETEAEQRWIEFLRSEGSDLLNARDGGLVGFELSEGARQRMATAQAIAQNRPEQKERNRESNRRTAALPEVRSRMETMRAEAFSRPEVIAKMSASAKRRMSDPAVRERLADAQRGHTMPDHVRALLHRVGEDNPSAVLDEAAVRSIRAAILTGQRHAEIAAVYGVSRSLIGAIGRREAWAHLP